MADFELVPVLDEGTGKYVVKEFETMRKIVVDFVNSELSRVVSINDDIALKSVRATRTDIRKKKDAITQARIHINALLLGEFNAQLKDIETILDDADNKLKKMVDDYKTEVGGAVNKPKVITLVIKGYDMDAIEEIRASALKKGLYAEVK